MINPVSGEPMKVSKQQLEDIEHSRSVSPTNEVLSTLTKIAGSTGGSLLVFLALLPLVLKNLTIQLPQLAAIFATISQAIKDPSKTAEEFGVEMAETIVSLPAGFFGELVSTGFDIGGDILGGPVEPFTPAEATPTGTVCERFEFDLIEIKRKLDKSSGIAKIQGTYAWAAKLMDMKKAGCSRPGFVSSGTWSRIPT